MLPGQKIKHVPNTHCEFCYMEDKDTPSTCTVVGETDSFGSEHLNLCDDCYKEANRTVITGTCNWCSKEAELTHMRDFDEGTSGPVYEVCTDCKRKKEKDAVDELEAMDDDHYTNYY